MLKPVVSVQLPVAGKTYGKYLRMEVDDASPDALADAVRRLMEDPSEHEIGLPPLSAASHLRQKQKRKTEQDEPEMPGV
jgi:hypothetical protein